MTVWATVNDRLYKWSGMDFDLLKFMTRRLVLGFEIYEQPFFDSDEAVNWFLERLGRSRRYLEYGSGGSTVAAARLGVDFIAVESDRYFLRSLEQKLRGSGLLRNGAGALHYADIGLTGYVGQPLYHWRASERRRHKFRRYSDPPPECYADGRLPDLVLVDGRFRVACALKALRMLQNEREWQIVIDDYIDRPQYHVVDDFAERECQVGARMAVFNAAKPVPPGRLDEAIRHYETVPE